MSTETILVSEEAGVMAVTLNRPDRLNAVTAEMLDELKAAVAHAAETDPVRALLLTGAGRGFCAGQDLSDRAVKGGGERTDLSQTLTNGYNPLIEALAALEIPTICAVNGVAAGAGANLALACDIVVAGRSASFLQAFARIGLIPDSGGTYQLPRLVGMARAKGHAILAEPISAETAAEWGMIWKVVDDEALAGETMDMARRLAGGPTRGFALIKQALAASGGNDLAAQLALEAELQGEAGQSDDYAEGVAAFLEKRAPKFTGR